MRVLDWIIGREPVATAVGIAAVITAALGVAAAFGVDITAEQIAAIGALVTALAGWAGRSAVTPMAKLHTLYDTVIPVAGNRDYAAEDAERELDRHERGGLPLALLILAGALVIMIAGLGLCGDALFEDEDEVDDLGLRVELVSHDYCAADHEGCGGDDWGGGSDGNSGGRYEGGRGGSDYDGDGDGPRCRNFCFYGIPPPDGAPPGEGGGQLASLFPPTPDAVREFVLASIKGGIEMGRLFAETVIKFVENLLIGIA